MRMIIASVVIPAALAATAAASPPASVGDIVTTPLPGTNIVLARKLLPASSTIRGAIAQSKVIYLNHHGVTLTPGDDDSRTNHSSIISSHEQRCRRGTRARRPGTRPSRACRTCSRGSTSRSPTTIRATTPHIEAVFGGSPQNIGMGQGVGGVSPFTEDCGIIENSIVFTFTNVFPDDAQTVCEVMAQEVAHSYGLDHEMLASDPMTYLDYNGNRSVQGPDGVVRRVPEPRRAASAARRAARTRTRCSCSTQRLGKADLVAPTLGITVARRRRDRRARLRRRGDRDRQRRA